MDRRWQLVLDCLDTEQAPFTPMKPCLPNCGRVNKLLTGAPDFVSG
jgi:hypothetical protein